MKNKTLQATTRTLAIVLVGASPLAGCTTDAEDIDERELALAEDVLDEPTDGEAGEELAAAIAAAPELADEDVEALFADGEPTLRDVIRLVDPEHLPADLTIEDLDRPVTLELTEPVIEPLFDTIGDYTAEIEPQFLGEQACATTSIANPNNGATIPISPPPACGSTFDAATSPTGTYNPVGCPKQFITEVTGVQLRPLSFRGQWAGVELTQANCDRGRLRYSAYGALWVIQNVGGAWIVSLQWTKIAGPTYLFAWWNPSGECQWDYQFEGLGFPYDPGAHQGPLPSLDAGHSYTRVRVAAQAMLVGLLPPSVQRVSAGVRHFGGPPCP